MGIDGKTSQQRAQEDALNQQLAEERAHNARIAAEQELARVKALRVPLEVERTAIAEARRELAQRFVLGDALADSEDRAAQEAIADLTRRLALIERAVPLCEIEIETAHQIFKSVVFRGGNSN